ncbi:AAA family ATPase [Desmonostoc muscorum CCALA 125]|nr:AAA family ATPase [Desmonostoc muscorum CCALA 125]
MVDRLKTIFIKNFDFPPLSYEQIDTIKATIFPETAIKLIPVYNDNITNNIQLNRSYGFQTLDRHQECIVRTIGEGHRIIYGVAGSGKTLILICHAKLLISQNPDQKILLICFNRSLAAYLKSILYDYLESQNISNRIEVLTFYAWVNSVIPKIPAQSGFSTEYYDGILGDILLEKLNKIPKSQKYDAILIDEAQTFHPTWFKCCVAALKDPENGNLLIVADGSQSVYKRSNFTWKSVGIKAVGRTSNKRINLDKNYRNTQEILTAAWSLFSYYHTDSENLIFDIVKPIDALRHGLHPILHIEKSEKHEIESVIREIKELKKSGYDLNEMAIIYRMADDKKTVLIDNFIRELNKLQLATYWVSQSRINEKQYSNKNYGIKIISSLSALGLEFKIVFIIWVQDWEFNISPVSESDILTCKRLYVAMTRAQEILHIFGSGNSRLLKQLHNSEYFTIKQ